MCKRRIVFEAWVRKQLSKTISLDFSDPDGYSDSDINMLWIGFNAGIELSELTDD